MRRPTRLALPIALLTCLVCAAAALAAHPVAGAFYSGNLGKGVGFRVSGSGKKMRFRGHAVIGLACGPNKPPTGSALAQFNLNSHSAPRVRITRDGHFHGVRSEGSVSVLIIGRFTGKRRLVFTVRTGGGGLGRCSSARYKLHASRRLKRRR